MSKREPQEQLDAYELVFTALAHPARRQILITVYFKGGTMAAGQIANLFQHAWPTTTRHLQVLESAGLLHHERKGRKRQYRIDVRRLELVRAWLAWFSRTPRELNGNDHAREKESQGRRDRKAKRSQAE